MESVETTPAVVRAYRYSPDSAYSQPEGSFILGPPIVPEQVDVRDKGARWSCRFNGFWGVMVASFDGVSADLSSGHRLVGSVDTSLLT